ncbi:Aldedh-domain-containing protein [Acaromyces ingoldii]|uniref:Aldedh-domain-containing protein n=1 Tax=Acaromyces ingoldii TaxID=215250 RepID=A0A316YYR9_9BASI|nr:Aldedh-domain-containing protein [Acaromyces ingoldii]PWN94186.1 Aldedh-domain-containing protein [Acaromyces ingoldii]
MVTAIAQQAAEAKPALATIAVVVVSALLGVWLVRFNRERPHPVSLPRPEQATAGWKPERILEPPGIRDAKRPSLIIAYDPATGGYLDELPADTPETIEEKLKRAEIAQAAWKRSSWSRRRIVLKTIKKWLVDDVETICRVACRDTGKTAVDAVLGELLTTFSKLDWLIGNLEPVLRPQTRPNNLMMVHKRCTVHHEPVGVVSALVSWNYPCHNALSPALAALASGNAIVVKGSEMVVWSTTYFIQGVRACLAACGEPEDLVQLVCSFPDVAPALTANPRVKHLTFIGSEPVARHVAKDAATALTPCCLELGGKDPMVILADADVNYFLQTWLRAAFHAAGQNCIGAERFIVASSILPRLIGLLEPRVRALRCGSFLDDTSLAADAKNPTTVDVGAMISDNRFDRLEELVQDAVNKGARCLVGGKRFQHPLHPQGHYFAPTLLVDVTPDMTIAHEELFAPVFLVMSFETTDEAVAIANSSRYGLGSSVFGNSQSECRAVADRLEAGMVNINDFAVSYLNQGLPFGGVKASGYGRFGGPEGLLSLTTTKAVTEDALFSWIRTGIPPPLHYPLNDAQKCWTFVRGLVTVVYGDMSQKLTGLQALLKAAL